MWPALERGPGSVSVRFVRSSIPGPSWSSLARAGASVCYDCIQVLGQLVAEENSSPEQAVEQARSVGTPGNLCRPRHLRGVSSKGQKDPQCGRLQPLQKGLVGQQWIGRRSSENQYSAYGPNRFAARPCWQKPSPVLWNFPSLCATPHL